MFAVYAVAILAVVAQAYGQCIPSCATGVAPVYPPCGCVPGPIVAPAPVVAATAPVLAAPATVVQSNSVAATLADTLSLLTVSSLLAEKLPYGCACALPPPAVYPGCGCGYGYVL